MKVFFVVDIKGGRVVWGKGGERESYRPVTELSSIVSSDEPVKVISQVKPKFLYAADLDRIMGRGNNLGLLSEISKMVEELIADCGFKSPEEIGNLPFTPVVGTETFDLTKLNRKCYVSLDFKNKFLDASGKFSDFIEAVEFLNTFDLHGLIVLNIAAVGSMRPDFKILEKVLEISNNPVLLGGGIANLEDLEKLKEMGCSGVLVATAVHKRKIPLEVVRSGVF